MPSSTARFRGRHHLGIRERHHIGIEGRLRRNRQLFGWQRQALARGEVSIADGDQPMTFTSFEAVCSAPIEIVIGDIVVRAGPDVGADHLAAVIRAVRAA